MLNLAGFYRILELFFFSSRRRHTRLQGDWSSDVCSSDLHDGVHHPLNLEDAVEFMIDRTGDRQARVHTFKHCRHFCFVEIIQEDTRGRRPAIHHHNIAFDQRVHHAVYLWWVVGVDETDFRMEPFEGRVFVVTVKGRMADVAVFEVLDEVDGE